MKHARPTWLRRASSSLGSGSSSRSSSRSTSAGWRQWKCLGYPAVILGFSVVGVLGSYGVAWFGIRINTLPTHDGSPPARQAVALFCDSAEVRHERRMMLISVELLICCASFCSSRLITPPLLHRLRYRRSLGAAALRIAGGIFHQDRRHRLRLWKIVFKIKKRCPNPASSRLHGRQPGDSVGPER